MEKIDILFTCIYFKYKYIVQRLYMANNLIVSKHESCVDYVDYVDFDEEDKNENMKDNEIDSLYVRDGKKIVFDHKTMHYYKTMRFRKMDPIYMLDLEPDTCFKFYNEWNPYTGERLGIDPYGPLCFHPDSLIKYFYENRLNNLWCGETEHHGQYYEGYYDVAVGAGSNIYIQSRGSNPDKYLFRLPIIDCYWMSDIRNESIVTMGPVLTDDEVKQIDELADKHGSYYVQQYNKPRPSLFKIKQLYDTAISKKPLIEVSDTLTDEQKRELYDKINRQAVDKLKAMKG